MKKLMFPLLITFVANFCYSQELFLVFEFMKVEDNNLLAYMENEDFWEKVHQEGVKAGAYTGWDLWSLKPGGSEQGYQFLTVTLYDKKSAMLTGSTIDQIIERAQKAYPAMESGALQQKLIGGTSSRSRAKIAYVEQIDTTEDEFEMPVGTYMEMSLMKATGEGYEKAESEIFKPLFQKAISDGAIGSWGLVRFISPTGSDAYTSHMTFNMYKDVDQFVDFDNYDWEQHVQDWDVVNKALETRDLKWNYHGTLLKKVR